MLRRDTSIAALMAASATPVAPAGPATVATCTLLAMLTVFAGCALRAAHVAPAPVSSAEFLTWDCARIDDELDGVQQRAADLAYAVDERAGNNIIALGVGLTVFWPAILAMRPDGLEAADLAKLKGRFEALRSAAADKACPPPAAELSAARAAMLPLALGERLVYEDRGSARGPAVESVLRLTALRRGEIEFQLESGMAPGQPALQADSRSEGQAEGIRRDRVDGGKDSRSAGRSETRAVLRPRAAAPGAATGAAPPPAPTWRQDRSGNIVGAPPGALQWPQLLRGELVLGAVTGGDIAVTGDPLQRARIRGQVVAVGPQTVAGRSFDVAVVELFGDAQNGEAYTRVDGAIVVDRTSGVLLRLDLRSGNPHFSLQRRLLRIEPPG